MIRPQSMLFTLFGDYVIRYGGEISVPALIRIGREFELSEAAMRSALSRMSKAGWLAPRRNGSRACYALTSKTEHLLKEGIARIFNRRDDRWNGEWSVVCYELAETPRDIRDRFRRRLTWLGFGSLMPGTWVAPRNLIAEIQMLVEDLRLAGSIEYFCGRHLGMRDDHHLVAHCWNLAEINDLYTRFLANYEPAYERDRRLIEAGTPPLDNECFVHRFLLIHDYRQFFRIDPELPSVLLPSNWAGGRAAALFDAYHRLLSEAAVRFYLSAG